MIYFEETTRGQEETTPPEVEPHSTTPDQVRSETTPAPASAPTTVADAPTTRLIQVLTNSSQARVTEETVVVETTGRHAERLTVGRARLL